MGDLMSYNVQAAVGREFNKVIGGRFALNAWKSKGGSSIKGVDYKWKWNYIAPTVDVTFNLSNLISGVNPNRVFTVGAFAGLGMNIGWGNDEAKNVDATLRDLTTAKWMVGEIENKDASYQAGLDYLWDGTKARFLLQAGLTGDIKINDKFAVTLEVSANTLSDKYNSKKAKNWDRSTLVLPTQPSSSPLQSLRSAMLRRSLRRSLRFPQLLLRLLLSHSVAISSS